MGKVNMYAIVPTAVASELREQKRVKNYNNLKQISPHILKAVRKYMEENTGFSDGPIACLSLNERAREMSSDELCDYLPVNSKDSVLFQLQMDEDMIVSIGYGDLLEASQDAEVSSDSPEDMELILEEFTDKLELGKGEGISGDEEVISFIPFIDYKYCKGYAKFNENFGTEEFEMPGVEKISLATLSAFID